MNLVGAGVVITGGSKGIGLAIAESLVRAGANVFICGRSKTALANALSDLRALGNANGETCDVRSEEQVRSMLDEARRELGRIDVLVNNSGVGILGKTVEELSGDEFREMLETNLFGVFYACHYVIPMMKPNGGYIINISSLAGQYPRAKMAAYNASKFGLNGFSEALMQEVRNDGIKVSCICPGSVNTGFGGDVPSNNKAWQLQPEDIAETVMNLLSMDSRALPSRVEIRPSRPPSR